MWKDSISALDRKRNRILQAGGRDKIEKQHKSGKLTARERIDMLFDPGTFVEVDNFIESRIDDFGLDKKRVPGDGVVTGYGEIDGRTVFVSSEDFTVIGGSLGEYHSMKIARIQDMAYDMKAPIIMINDSGGARIEEGIDSLFRRDSSDCGDRGPLFRRSMLFPGHLRLYFHGKRHRQDVHYGTAGGEDRGE